MQHQTCSTCTFYDEPETGGRNVCRLLPPVPTFNGHKITSAYSMPKPDDWCSEYMDESEGGYDE